MYLPPAFSEDRAEVLHQLMRTHPLATLVSHGSHGLVANLVPFILPEGEPTVLRAHLARANDQLVDLYNAAEALVIFQGPQAYVSPSWYPTKQQHGKVVPTWNYVVVQVWGRPRVLDDAHWVRQHLENLTDEHERHRLNRWTVADAPEPYVAAQLKGIVGLEITIQRIEGKWKASQNQPAENRVGVATGLRDQDPTSPMANLVDVGPRSPHRSLR